MMNHFNTMKNLLRISMVALLCLTVFCTAGWSTKASAQNLQFNRVFLKQGLGNVTDTVPAGKVWKIEHLSCNSPSKTAYYIGINGQVYNLYNHESSGNSAYHDHFGPHGPIWLPAGTVLQGGNGALTYTFSIIEFNITP